MKIELEIWTTIIVIGDTSHAVTHTSHDAFLEYARQNDLGEADLARARANRDFRFAWGNGTVTYPGRVRLSITGTK